MTLIVGILCTDGVVLASDSEATYAAGAVPTIGQQQVTKVMQLGERMLYASTGAIGASRVVAEGLEKLTGSGLKASTVTSPTAAMTLIGETIARTMKPLFDSARGTLPFVSQAEAGLTVTCKWIVGYLLREQPCLFQFDSGGIGEEIDQLSFVALGSGQAIADPFLAFLKRILWKDSRPTMAEGRLVAAWTVMHVSTTTFGYVGLPLQMASLSCKTGKPLVEMIAPDEHYQKVVEAEAALRDHVKGKPATASAEAPPPPGAP